MGTVWFTDLMSACIINMTEYQIAKNEQVITKWAKDRHPREMVYDLCEYAKKISFVLSNREHAEFIYQTFKSRSEEAQLEVPRGECPPDAQEPS